MALVPNEGCLQSADVWCLNSLICGGGGCRTALTPPIVETIVAEPRASIVRRDSETVFLADNAPREALALEIPQGHALLICLAGRAQWSEGTQGRIGFYLTIQEFAGGQASGAPDAAAGDWVTLGSTGTSGTYSGEFMATGRLRIPVLLDRAGIRRLRASLRCIAQPPRQETADVTGPEGAEDQDAVEIVVTVLPGPLPVVPPELPPIDDDDSPLEPASN
jgi:hypothetical protein